MPIPLHMAASRTLGLNQRETAELCGVSTRTVQRWMNGRSALAPHDYRTLAQAVFPHDPELAGELAVAGGVTLEKMGLAEPPPSVDLIIDSVLCAAAVAVDMKPLELRPALLAAFKRARMLKLSLEAVESALETADGSARKKK
jgi:transcriptional regulator with XRE-family HTH domain